MASDSIVTFVDVIDNVVCFIQRHNGGAFVWWRNDIKDSSVIHCKVVIPYRVTQVQDVMPVVHLCSAVSDIIDDLSCCEV